jgi:hypothetical protein
MKSKISSFGILLAAGALAGSALAASPLGSKPYAQRFDTLLRANHGSACGKTTAGRGMCLYNKATKKPLRVGDGVVSSAGLQICWSDNGACQPVQKSSDGSWSVCEGFGGCVIAANSCPGDHKFQCAPTGGGPGNEIKCTCE